MRAIPRTSGLLRAFAAAGLAAGLVTGEQAVAAPVVATPAQSSPTAATTLAPYEIAAARGINEPSTKTWSSVVWDYDSDGWPDLFLNRHWGVAPRLLRNVGGRFSEVLAGTWRARDRHGCAAADVNRDGRPDLYCMIGGGGSGFSSAPQPNELWIQQPDRTFRDMAQAWGVTDPYGMGRMPVFLDVNRDGRPDLYTTNGFPRPDGKASLNRLYLNTGASFREAPEYGLTRRLGGLRVSTGDVDADGWPDLLVSANSSLKLYRNNAGRSFSDVSSAYGIATVTALDAELVDVDGDGRLDLGFINQRNVAVRLQRNGTFAAASISRAMKDGRELAFADVNGDRRPDLYAVDRDNTVADRLLVNVVRGAFTDSPMPLVPGGAGAGDAAMGIDIDRNGRAEMLVLNGADTGRTGFRKGPVQLFAFADS